MTVTLDLDAKSQDPFTRRSLADLSLSVAKSQKIVVVTGAGISCSCGIPDFRSSDGLYALVKKKYPDVVLKGRDLFDASLFRDPTSASVFYTFISQLKNSIDAVAPTPTHRFIKTLDTKKKLLRSYTQNIDGLEAKAGLLGTSCQEAKVAGKGKSKIRVKDIRNVQLHGDIHRVRCTFCSAEFPCTEGHLKVFNEGTPPDCSECSDRSEARIARSARALKIGKLRPAIVLYDEPHPLGDDIGTIQSADIARKPDMLIIMGTSLKVHGIKKLIKDFAKAVHASAQSSATSSLKNTKPWAGKVVFVNRTPPGSEWADIIDYHVSGETDKWVEKVVEDWKKKRPADWEVQKTLIATDGDVSMRSPFKAAKEAVAVKSRAKGMLVAGTKKTPTGAENVPPIDSPSTSFDCVLVPTPPLSPSKRRQAASHYCDVESSPSKKRDIAPVLTPFEGTGLLFGNSTNVLSNNSDLDRDVETVPKVRSQRVKAAAVGGRDRVGRPKRPSVSVKVKA